MYITIDNTLEFTDDFLRWLIRRMFVIGLDYVSNHKQKLLPIDSYLKTFFDKRKYTAQEIIVAGLKNMTISHNQKQSIISINNNTKVPRTDKVLLHKVCQLINYGNMELRPFPIFTYVFEYVSNNINDLYNEYLSGIIV